MKPSALTAAAFAAATLAASPAAAGQPAERVTYSDLQLTSAKGQAELEKRISRAVHRVGLFDEDGALHSAAEYAACYRAAKKDVDVQVARIIDKNRLGG